MCKGCIAGPSHAGGRRAGCAQGQTEGGGHGTTLGWVFPAPVASRSESPLWGRQGGGRRGSQLLLLPCRILLPSQV